MEKPLESVQADKMLCEGFGNTLVHMKALPAGHVICSLAWDEGFLFSELKGQVDNPAPRRDWPTAHKRFLPPSVCVFICVYQ